MEGEREALEEGRGVRIPNDTEWANWSYPHGAFPSSLYFNSFNRLLVSVDWLYYYISKLMGINVFISFDHFCTRRSLLLLLGTRRRMKEPKPLDYPCSALLSTAIFCCYRKQLFSKSYSKFILMQESSLNSMVFAGPYNLKQS